MRRSPYQLTATTPAPLPQTQQTVLTGAQRSKGLEIGLERSISDNWQISAGYAWQNAEITETTAAAPQGRKVPLVPKHSFSLWTRYDFTDQLGAGLGVIARSKSYASISNAVTLPGYARVDGAFYYKVTRDIRPSSTLNSFGPLISRPPIVTIIVPPVPRPRPTQPPFPDLYLSRELSARCLSFLIRDETPRSRAGSLRHAEQKRGDLDPAFAASASSRRIPDL